MQILLKVNVKTTPPLLVCTILQSDQCLSHTSFHGRRDLHKQVSKRLWRDSRSQGFLREAPGLTISGELLKGEGERLSLAMKLLYWMGLLSTDSYVPAEDKWIM